MGGGLTRRIGLSFIRICSAPMAQRRRCVITSEMWSGAMPKLRRSFRYLFGGVGWWGAGQVDG